MLFLILVAIYRIYTLKQREGFRKARVPPTTTAKSTPKPTTTVSPKISSSGKCTNSDDCDDTSFCWENLCYDTNDPKTCTKFYNKKTDDGWKWNCNDLYTDSGFQCFTKKQIQTFCEPTTTANPTTTAKTSNTTSSLHTQYSTRKNIEDAQVYSRGISTLFIPTTSPLSPGTVNNIYIKINTKLSCDVIKKSVDKIKSNILELLYTLPKFNIDTVSPSIVVDCEQKLITITSSLKVNTTLLQILNGLFKSNPINIEEKDKKETRITLSIDGKVPRFSLFVREQDTTDPIAQNECLSSSSGLDVQDPHCDTLFYNIK